MGPNPMYLVSSLKKKLGHKTSIKGRPCEDTVRKWPSASKGERPQKIPDL